MQVKIPWVLICIKFLLVLSVVMYVQTKSTKNKTERMNKDPLGNAIFKLEPNDDICMYFKTIINYNTLFKCLLYIKI